MKEKESVETMGIIEKVVEDKIAGIKLVDYLIRLGDGYKIQASSEFLLHPFLKEGTTVIVTDTYPYRIKKVKAD